MGRSADPTLPVRTNLLRQGELGGGLSPALLFLIEVRRVSPVMFEQTVLQVQAQKLHVAAVKLAIERPRAAVHQRLQIGIIV
ncbi:Uncharacterised protein [Klebsiella pneumoniae]|uniref:Uncharacterized protein n=1 Tax=Klebsiella pneumoniae TaxID=573 RepID=A0A378AE94_KLEPN|nr:Uncharacterised protein [Klebsiella pneumoniae]